MKSEKKVLGVLISKFETHAKYTWVADEEQKKKDLRCFKGEIACFNSRKGAIWKKSLGNPGLDNFFICSTS